MRVLIGIMMVGLVIARVAMAADPTPIAFTGTSATPPMASTPPVACVVTVPPAKPCPDPVDERTLMALCVLGLIAAGAFITRACLDRNRQVYEAKQKTVQELLKAMSPQLGAGVKDSNAVTQNDLSRRLEEKIAEITNLVGRIENALGATKERKP